MNDKTDRSRTKVAVLYGGYSEERDVSLASGSACAAALTEAGFETRLIDVPRDIKSLVALLSDPKPDVVFNALHGKFGEDGHIQSILNILEIPYTHSGLLASALAMDKPAAIAQLSANGIPCPRGTVLSPDELKTREHPMPRPYVVKPAREGSSVGVYIVLENDPRPDYQDWHFGPALVEEYIPGRELTVAVMNDRAFCVTELRPLDGFYDYEAKYTDGKTEHLCPAPVSHKVAETCMDIAVRAHAILGCRGVSRADFRYDDTDPENERIILLEVNTQPGMTDLSLVPEQARYLGVSFPDLVTMMVEAAACDS